MRSVEMPGPPINSSRMFFVADPVKGQGVHAFMYRVSETDLEPDDGESFRIKDTALFPGFKMASELRFFRWKKAVLLTADVLALAALARIKVVLG